MAVGGLEGVIAAETVLSDVDGEGGRLIIKGHPVESLAGHASYEAATALLLGGTELDCRRALAEGRTWAASRLEVPATKDGMEALRATIARLPENATAAQLIAAVGLAVARWVDPKAEAHPELGHAEALLHGVMGAKPTKAQVAAFETYLVATLDHGLNASTFTARVVASTQSDLVSCITAALGALKGPLHGGAIGPVLDLLDGIGTVENAERWLRTELDAGRRLMGFGHRVYRTRDPRAFVQERAIAALEHATTTTNPRLALARHVERTAERLLAERHPDRPLKANVEFYGAVLLEAVGVPRRAFTPVFASARVVGWCAHVEEQRASGRLIRPASKYVGPKPAA